MSEWSVYLLSNGKRTYVGSTTDPVRRLRQHNGEIRGGARSTAGKGPWSMVLHVAGFPDRSSACRWEKLVKSRARGLTDRHMALMGLVLGKCPLKRNLPLYTVPGGLIGYRSTSNEPSIPE